MDTFWYIASGMILLALGFVLPPLLRRRDNSSTLQAGAELAVFRQRQRELKDDLERGALDTTAYQAAELELQTALLEAGQHFRLDAPAPRQHRMAAILVLLLIPGLAITLYRYLGSHDRVVAAANSDAEAQKQMAELRTGIGRLEAQLAKHPDDKKMWHMLGRARLELKDYAQAYIAFGKAEALDGNDVDILLDKVLALAGMQDTVNTPEQMNLIERVLNKDPNSQRGLWIGSLVALEQARSDLARDYLQRLLALTPEGDKNAELIRRQLAAIEQSNTTATNTGTPDSDGNAKPVSNAQITVNVRIAPELTGKVAADDTVFVFARAKSGPKMPLAVERIQVRELPKTIVLDDQKAMAPNMSLGSYAGEVTVGARISRSGRPEGGTGDYQGFAAESIRLTNAASNAAVDITVDKAVP